MRVLSEASTDKREELQKTHQTVNSSQRKAVKEALHRLVAKRLFVCRHDMQDLVEQKILISSAPINIRKILSSIMQFCEVASCVMTMERGQQHLNRFLAYGIHALMRESKLMFAKCFD